MQYSTIVPRIMPEAIGMDTTINEAGPSGIGNKESLKKRNLPWYV